MQNKRKIKNEGQIFTPAYLVKDMLDFIGYNGYGILNKHIMENSCGDGAFLCEIVRRYCSLFPHESLKNELETFIHGIEKDRQEYEKCIENLNSVAAEFDMHNVKWDIQCGDALELSKNYYGQMDFVVGNPPYIRVHNLGNNYDISKKFSFAAAGMTDSYLVFFEIGLKLLTDTGRISLITPGSWLRSNAGQNFREYISRHKNLRSVIDLEHFQPFENAVTYTIISLFDNSQEHQKFSYYRYNAPANMDFVDNLKYSDAFINNKIYLADKNTLLELRDIEVYGCGDISVKNGFATLADDVFIGEFSEGKHIIPVIKSSTGQYKKCIFPYKKDGTPLPEFVIMDDKYIWNYLSENKGRLESRSITNKKDWYLFGRTQALKDVAKNKIAVNQLIKNKDSLKLNYCPAGTGVYGGLYIVSEFDFSVIENILSSDKFVSYVKALKNYKSGGYYTFSSNDLEKFLNYNLNERKENEFRFVANA